MTVSLYVCSTLRIEAKRRYPEILSFLRAGSACPLIKPLDSSGNLALLERHAACVISLREDGPEGIVLGSIVVFEARNARGISLIDDHPHGVNVYFIGALRVAESACGFDRDIASRLIQEAITFVATADSDNEGADAKPSCVLMVTSADDRTMKERVAGLGAARVADPPKWLNCGAAKCLAGPNQHIWWITQDAARGAAEAVRDRSKFVTKRQDRSGRVRQLSVSAAPGWLTTAAERIEALATGATTPNWCAPPRASPFIFSGGQTLGDPLPVRARLELPS